MYVYYSTQRPVGPGTFPKKSGCEVYNFANSTYCPKIGRMAWGYISYIEPLTDKEAAEYELTGEND